MTLQQTLSLQHNLAATLQHFYPHGVEIFRITPLSPWTVTLKRTDGSINVISAPTQLEALRAAILS